MKHRHYKPNETDRTAVEMNDPSKQYVVEGGSTLAGNDLSTTRSSHRKGRKSATSRKKLEQQAI